MLNDEQKGIFINDFNDPKEDYGLKGAAESVGTKELLCNSNVYFR